MIPPLDLNLSTRPFRNNTLPWLGLLLGVTVLGLMTWWNVTTYLSYNEQYRALREELGSYDSQMANLGMRENRAEMGIRQHDTGLLQIQADRANDVIQLKAFSWTRLFNRLEKVLPYEVKMSTVRPMFRLGTRRSETAAAEEAGIPIQVEGIAKTLDAFHDFQRNLLDDPYFDRIAPEQRSRMQGSEEQLFKIRFHYYPEESPASMREAAEEAGEMAGSDPGDGPEEEG
jgi:Tfp pilus assembly protein PilN